MAEQVALTVDRENWNTLQRQCKAFIASQLLPKHVTHLRGAAYPPQVAMARALAIATTGKEVGMAVMESLRSIQIIEGVPRFSTEALLSLAYRRVPGFKLVFLTPPEKEHEECTVEAQKAGLPPQRFTYTKKDAVTAGLIRPGGGWEKSVVDMLQSRAISRACRRVAPEATQGCYAHADFPQSDQPTTEIETVEVVKEDESPTSPADTPKGNERPETKINSALADVTLTKRTDKRGFPHGDYPKGNPTWETDLATEKQIEVIRKISKAQGFTDEELEQTLAVELGKKTLEELTVGEASKLIQSFNAKK